MELVTVFCIVFVVCFSVDVEGHGYMIIPTNRASLWRVDWTRPVNFNDNEYFCGGTHVQYYKNEGRCGPCGDDWNDPTPRSNENGGTFGNSIIVANYTAGSVIEVTSMITANHLGSLYFHICELKDPSLPESEDCFEPIKLADGTDSRRIAPLELEIKSKVKLPKDLVCERCVLRWHYRTGNSWGMCEDGTQNLGCGNQEIFRSCADIRIVPGDSSDEIPFEDSDENNPSQEDPSVIPDNNLPEDHKEEEPCFLKGNYKTYPRINKNKSRF